MRRLIVALTLLLGILLVTPTEAQSRFWVLVNGALRYTGAVTIVGPLTITGNTVSTGSFTTTNSLQVGAAMFLGFFGRAQLQSSADKLMVIEDNAGATGMELNVGTPALGTCTGGSLVSGSHNFGGEITGNTSGSCVLNFGTPNFTNTPFCTLNDETSLVAARVSSRSASSITITGLTSGDAVQYICVGRIGT